MLCVILVCATAGSDTGGAGLQVGSQPPRAPTDGVDDTQAEREPPQPGAPVRQLHPAHAGQHCRGQRSSGQGEVKDQVAFDEIKGQATMLSETQHSYVNDIK